MSERFQMRVGREVIWAFAMMAAACLGGCAQPTVDPPKENKGRIFFPPAPSVSRIQFLCSLSGADDIEPPESRRPSAFADFVTGKPKEEKGYHRIGRAYGIAVRDGKLFVADSKNACIAVMDMRKKQFSRFGRTGPGRLRKPINVRLDQAGRIYVTDTLRREVVVFQADGEYVKTFGDNRSLYPVDVAVVGDELYVLDGAANCIKIYDLSTGKAKRSFCSKGMAPGKLDRPTNMIVDDKGMIYVTDMMNFRVQKLDSSGRCLGEFGQSGLGPGAFARPKGIAVDRDGILYIVDAMSAIVQMLDQRNRPLMHFGELGIGPGRLYLPAQVIVDYENIEPFRKYVAPGFKVKYLLFVTNQFGPNRISVYAFGRGAGGKKPPPTP
jgi:DNA-binding beta-propeller fold protein YncE